MTIDDLQSELRAALAALGSGVPPHILAVRTATSAALRVVLDKGRAAAEDSLKRSGKGTACAIWLSDLEDMIIRTVFDFARLTVFPDTRTVDQEMAVIAVGGYGRGTLAPGSDIDLLFVVPVKPDTRVNSIVEFLLYALWDARQKVGHATRNVAECLKLSKTDITIMTAILEARFICGSRSIFSDLSHRFRKSIVQTSAKNS
jgi:[protein-PII] uridylyltransferase